MQMSDWRRGERSCQRQKAARRRLQAPGGQAPGQHWAGRQPWHTPHSKAAARGKVAWAIAGKAAQVSVGEGQRGLWGKEGGGCSMPASLADRAHTRVNTAPWHGELSLLAQQGREEGRRVGSSRRCRGTVTRGLTQEGTAARLRAHSPSGHLTTCGPLTQRLSSAQLSLSWPSLLAFWSGEASVRNT